VGIDLKARLSGGRTVREKPINQSGGIVLLDQARFELASAERESSHRLEFICKWSITRTVHIP